MHAAAGWAICFLPVAVHFWILSSSIQPLIRYYSCIFIYLLTLSTDTITWREDLQLLPCLLLYSVCCAAWLTSVRLRVRVRVVVKPFSWVVFSIWWTIKATKGTYFGQGSSQDSVCSTPILAKITYLSLASYLVGARGLTVRASLADYSSSLSEHLFSIFNSQFCIFFRNYHCSRLSKTDLQYLIGPHVSR
jgi:hypothetical protein